MHEVNHLNLLDEMLDTLIQSRVRRIFRDIVITILRVFKLRDERMRHAELGAFNEPGFGGEVFQNWPYLHSFRRIVFASSEGHDVRLVSRWVDAAFF